MDKLGKYIKLFNIIVGAYLYLILMLSYIPDTIRIMYFIPATIGVMLFNPFRFYRVSHYLTKITIIYYIYAYLVLISFFAIIFITEISPLATPVVGDSMILNYIFGEKIFSANHVVALHDSLTTIPYQIFAFYIPLLIVIFDLGKNFLKEIFLKFRNTNIFEE